MHLSSPRLPGKSLPEYTAQDAEAFAELLRVFRPLVVLAALNRHNALPAALAERGGPAIFFMRCAVNSGFWGCSSVCRDQNGVFGKIFFEEKEVLLVWNRLLHR